MTPRYQSGPSPDSETGCVLWTAKGSTRLAVQYKALQLPTWMCVQYMYMSRWIAIAQWLLLLPLLGPVLVCAAPSTGTGTLCRCYRRLICKGTRTGATGSVRSASLACPNKLQPGEARGQDKKTRGKKRENLLAPATGSTELCEWLGLIKPPYCIFPIPSQAMPFLGPRPHEEPLHHPKYVQVATYRPVWMYGTACPLNWAKTLLRITAWVHLLRTRMTPVSVCPDSAPLNPYEGCRTHRGGAQYRSTGTSTFALAFVLLLEHQRSLHLLAELLVRVLLLLVGGRRPEVGVGCSKPVAATLASAPRHFARLVAATRLLRPCGGFFLEARF